MLYCQRVWPSGPAMWYPTEAFTTSTLKEDLERSSQTWCYLNGVCLRICLSGLQVPRKDTANKNTGRVSNCRPGCEVGGTQRVQLECQYGIRTQKPYHKWFLSLSSVPVLYIGMNPLGNKQLKKPGKIPWTAGSRTIRKISTKRALICGSLYLETPCSFSLGSMVSSLTRRP